MSEAATVLPASGIFRGEVVHQRYRPKRHRFAYRVFSLLLDLDELPRLDRGLRLFSYNRPGLLAFYDRDHGDGSGAPLRDWIEPRLAAAGVPRDGGAIRIHCYPRMFGYVFNPLSVYFCYHRTGGLAALRVVILQGDDGGPLLRTVFHGERRALTDAELAACLVRYPLMTLKVILGIHWQALRLWTKGVPVLRRPPPPRALTIVSRQPR